MSRRPLTAMMQHVLGVIVDCGPCDAQEVSRNWNLHGIGPVLGGLERRGLIGRDYTSQSYRTHGYYVTEAGREVYATLFGGDDA